MELKVITIEETAFYELVNKIIAEVKKQYGEQAISQWIDTKEAMGLLKITSKTTLQRLRDEGKIRYSQPMTKVILYERKSIMDYIENNARDTF